MLTNSTSCWESVNDKINNLSLHTHQHNVDTFRMANRLKELRLKRDLTQDQLGDLVGCSGQQIQYLEAGKRNMTELWMKRLAGPLKVKPHELMYESSEEVVENQKEKDLLATFRQMTDQEQKIYLSMASAFLKDDGAKPSTNKKKGNGN